MNATRQLYELGQNLWLDNMTRDLLSSGQLARYIREFSITGITSNPTIFDQALMHGDAYDDAILEKSAANVSDEALFFDLALDDLRQAADLLRRVHEANDGDDGWVSVEVSPTLANDTAGTIKAAIELHARADRPNILIKIPGTGAGIPAIEEAIFAGVPVNVTLLFSRAHYLAAAGAYMRGIERRLAAGLDPKVASVASIFVSRWDVAVNATVPDALRNRLGIAIALRTYKAYRDLLAWPHWRRLAAAGARPQRLLWASTGVKDPAAADTLYVDALAAPNTLSTLPEDTLRAFAEHGTVRSIQPLDLAAAEATLAQFSAAGVDIEALAELLQQQGVDAFVASWRRLLQRIAGKREVPIRVSPGMSRGAPSLQKAGS
jgi:transaldolase